MTYKVTFSAGNSYSVKLSEPSDYKVNQSYILEIMPQNLDELADVQISGNNDMYVLMYDAGSGKWRDVNPDTVISAATTEPIQPGLPSDFMDQMDISLDNRIDVDAGTF